MIATQLEAPERDGSLRLRYALNNDRQAALHFNVTIFAFQIRVPRL